MEPEGSLPRSRYPVTFPSSEPNEPTPSEPIFKDPFYYPPFFPSSKWFLFLRLLRQNPVCISPLVHSCHMPTHLIVLYVIIRVMLGEAFRLYSIPLCNFLQSPVSFSLLGSNVFPSALFSNTLTSCYSPNVRDQVSRPNNTTGKATVMYILIFIFLYSRREDKEFWT